MSDELNSLTGKSDILKEGAKPAEAKTAPDPAKEKLLKATAKGSSNAGQKRSAGREFLNEFLEDDMKTIGKGILENTILPTLKNTAYDIFESIGRGLFLGGSARKRPMGRPGGRNSLTDRENYNSYSNNNNREDRPKTIDDVVNSKSFDTGDDARGVIESLNEWLAEYDEVSVADYMNMGEYVAGYALRSYGWTREDWPGLDERDIYRAWDKRYYIRMPHAKKLPR